MGDIVRMLPKGVYTLADLPQRKPIDECAISTGWPNDLDRIWRIYPGQFTVVTGLPGHGKSTLAFNVVCNIGERGYRTFMFVPENEQSIQATLRRIWGSRKGWEDFSTGGVFIQSAAEEAFGDDPVDLRSILDRVVKVVEREVVDLLLIDPWNELEQLKPRDQIVTDYIREALMYLKRICRYHGVAVIVVVHPTKAVTERGGRTPSLADCEGSMSWYSKCDNGLIVEKLSDKAAKVISAKAREAGSGRIGECHFFVDPETGRFTPQYGGVAP